MSVLDTMEPRADQSSVAAAMPQAADTDGFSEPAAISPAATLALVGVTMLLALSIFARRRLAWCAGRVSAKFAAIIRWLRMREPDEI